MFVACYPADLLKDFYLGGISNQLSSNPKGRNLQITFTNFVSKDQCITSVFIDLGIRRYQKPTSQIPGEMKWLRNMLWNKDNYIKWKVELLKKDKHLKWNYSKWISPNSGMTRNR